MVKTVVEMIWGDMCADKSKRIQRLVKEDLEAILDNESYKESEYIDYKENFAVLECQDKRQRKEKQDEFRHDVCSFAN